MGSKWDNYKKKNMYIEENTELVVKRGGKVGFDAKQYNCLLDLPDVTSFLEGVEAGSEIYIGLTINAYTKKKPEVPDLDQLKRNIGEDEDN